MINFNILINPMFVFCLMFVRDMFILYENGYGKVIGRKKDVIIRGGENIFPTEIEEFFEKHPAILEAQVCIISNLIFKY